MGRTGYGPFDSDESHDWFCQVEKVIELPIRRAASGHQGDYERAYAAIWIALGIERQEARLFSDATPAVTASAIAARKKEHPHRKGHSRPRAARPAFWKLAKRAAMRMANDTAWLDDFQNYIAAAAAYRVLLSEVRTVIRAQRAHEAAHGAIYDLSRRVTPLPREKDAAGKSGPTVQYPPAKAKKRAAKGAVSP